VCSDARCTSSVRRQRRRRTWIGIVRRGGGGGGSRLPRCSHLDVLAPVTPPSIPPTGSAEAMATVVERLRRRSLDGRWRRAATRFLSASATATHCRGYWLRPVARTTPAPARQRLRIAYVLIAGEGRISAAVGVNRWIGLTPPPQARRPSPRHRLFFGDLRLNIRIARERGTVRCPNLVLRGRVEDIMLAKPERTAHSS
jgi:hypothetical protein